MSFYERYELLELDRDDGVKTFEAREIATGRPVKVHLFVAPASPYQAQLWRKIEQLPESESARILDRGKHEGTRYLVTDRLPDYPGLFEWVSASMKKADGKTPLETAGAWRVPPVAATPESSAALPDTPPATSCATPETSVPSAPASPSNTDLNREFADLFKTTERPVFSLPPEPAAPVPTAPYPAASAPAPPGEFTRMFQAPDAAARSSLPAQSPAAPSDRPAVDRPVPIQTGKEPGEFTRMFQAPVTPPAPPAARLPVTPATPGEFTRMFQAPAGTPPASLQGPAPGQSPPAAQNPPASSTLAGGLPNPPTAGPKSGPGEFTRFFEARSPAGPMPQSPAVQRPLNPQAPGAAGPNRAGEFTRMFGKGDVPAAPAIPTVANPWPAAPVGTSPVGQAPGGQTPPSAPAPPMAAQPFSMPVGSQSPGPPDQGSQPAGSPAAAPVPSGPGEYTRMFSAPAPMTLGQAPAEHYAGAQASLPPAAPGAPPRKSSLPLILGLAAILVVALLIVAFFALRPR